jgi:hypothetical protein
MGTRTDPQRADLRRILQLHWGDADSTLKSFTRCQAHRPCPVTTLTEIDLVPKEGRASSGGPGE